MAYGIFHIRLHIAQFAAAIVALALHEVGVDLLALHQHGDGVGQLDLVAGTGRGFFQQRPDVGREYITADHGQVGRGLVTGRFLDDGLHRQWHASTQLFTLDIGDAVFVHLALWNRFHHDLADLVFFEHVYHLGQVVLFRVAGGLVDQHVR